MISVKLFDLILKTVQTNNNYIFMFKVEEPSYYEVWGGSETDYDQQILDDNYLNTGYMSPYGWILYNTFGSPQINYQKTYTQSPLPYTQSYFTYSQYPVTYSQYPVTYSQTTTTTSTSITTSTTSTTTTTTSTTKVQEYLLPIKETTTTTKTTTSSTTEEPHFRKITTPTTTEETYIRKITTPVSIEDTTLGEATETMETTNAIIDDIVGTTIEEEEFTTLDSLNEKLIDSIEIYTTEINEEITIATIAIAEDTSEDSINFSVTEESSVGILEPVFDKDTGKNVFKFL